MAERRVPGVQEVANDALLSLLAILGTASPKGITITQALNESHPPNAQDAFGTTWRALLQRENVLLVESGQQLGQSALKKLSYEDLVSLGLGAKAISLRKPLLPGATMQTSRAFSAVPPNVSLWPPTPENQVYWSGRRASSASVESREPHQSTSNQGAMLQTSRSSSTAPPDNISPASVQVSWVKNSPPYRSPYHTQSIGAPNSSISPTNSYSVPTTGQHSYNQNLQQPISSYPVGANTTQQPGSVPSTLPRQMVSLSPADHLALQISNMGRAGSYSSPYGGSQVSDTGAMVGSGRQPLTEVAPQQESSGQTIQPGVLASGTGVTPKKRGRPKKLQTTANANQSPSGQFLTGDAFQQAPTAQIIQPPVALVLGAVATPKKRGRPKKVLATANASESSYSSSYAEHNISTTGILPGPVATANASDSSYSSPYAAHNVSTTGILPGPGRQPLPEGPLQQARTSQDVQSEVLTPESGIPTKMERKRKLPTTVDPNETFQGSSKRPRNRETYSQQDPEDHGQPSNAAARQSKAEQEFDELLQLAEAVPIPGNDARLPCLFQKWAGNLVLSTDDSILEFFWTAQHPPQLPILSLPVAGIMGSPTVSVPGSKPMQLRMTAQSGGDNQPTTHFFIYGSSLASAAAASSIRNKIINAKVPQNSRADVGNSISSEVAGEPLKPYQCDKCSARFKNANGLQYHQTKSKTTCNPDFVPPPPKEEPVPKAPKAPKVPRQTAKAAKPATPRKKRAQKDVRETDDESDADVVSNTSEDSIIGWARKTAGVDSSHPQTATPKSKTRRGGKIYKALNHESEVLEQILAALPEIRFVAKELEGNHLGAISPFLSSLPTLTDLADQMSSGEELSEEVYREMLMALIHANNDIFPGGKSLWMACIALWSKRHSDTTVLPKSTLCSKCIDDLIEEKKLQSQEFIFMAPKSKPIARTLIYVPGTDLTGPRCEMLKRLIRESHPSYYVPSNLAPPQVVLDALQALATRKLGVLLPTEVESSEDGNDEEDEDLVLFDSSSDVRDAETDSDSSDDEEFGMEENDGYELDSEADGIDDTNGLPGTKEAKQIYLRFRKLSFSVEKEQGASTTNGEIPNSQVLSDKPQAPVMQTTLQTSQGASSVMPDPETGAWNVSTAQDLEIADRGGTRTRRPGLSEPITFMQDIDGSWSVRPFGHGVKPVYSRSGRRTDGNPNLHAHLNNTGHGHRPVIFPTKVGMGQSNSASKSVLRRIAKGLLVKHNTPAVPPKPKRTKKKAVSNSVSEVSEDDLESDFEATAGLSPVIQPPPPRQKRKYTRRSSNAVDLDEYVEETDAELPEPKKLKLDAVTNPGLETLPPRFGLPPTMYTGPDIDSLDFPKKYFSVMYTEQKYMGEDPETRMEHSWTIRDLETAVDGYTVQWDDAFAFTSTSLPYNDLQDDEEISQNVAQKPAPKKPRRILSKRRPSKAKLQRSGIPWKPFVGEPTLKEKIGWTRAQTALSSDFAGLGRNPIELAAKFGIEVTEPSTLSRKRQRFGATTMSQTEENRFIAAVVAQRVLTGGLDMHVDWVLLSTVFKNHSINFLKSYWKRISEGKDEVMGKLVRDFQTAYPAAYRKGEVPDLDYNDLVSSDWNGLIDWVQNNVVTVFGYKDVAAPGTKKALKRKYQMVPIEADNEWRDTFFNLAAAKYKRVAAAATEPIAVPIVNKTRAQADDEDDLVRSLVRAIAFTPEEDWPIAKESAKEKVTMFTNDTVKEAIDYLVEAKVIMPSNKGRAVPGRGFQATETFSSNLRGHVMDSMFIEAVTYKRWMDEEFKSGTECLMVDYMANQGTVMALTSMQAFGRIKIECVGVPQQMFGLTDEGYETKKIPREKITFDMLIKPTSSYIFDETNSVLESILDAGPPMDNLDGKVPAWYNIGDVLIPDIWRKALLGVGQTVAFRAGINLKELAQIFKPSLEKWEIKLLMEWGTEVGLFERISEKVEGWKANEWWWVVVGSLCMM